MDHHCPNSASGSDKAASILVVEDEELLRFVAVEILEDGGFHVFEAANARDALTLLETEAVAVDLVFSDIQMPGDLDGCDLARWVHDHRPGLPVILTSGQVSDQALGEPLQDYAPIERKPYRVDALMHRIRAALGC